MNQSKFEQSMVYHPDFSDIEGTQNNKPYQEQYYLG